MPAITFQASALGPAASADLPEGGWLLDACDEARAPVGFSCRTASCGVCRVRIETGEALLEPPAAAEREVLDDIGAASGERLACQVRVLPGAGLVRLRWIATTGA